MGLAPNYKPKLPSHDSKSELADTFNSFFTQKIVKLREGLDSVYNRGDDAPLLAGALPQQNV